MSETRVLHLEPKNTNEVQLLFGPNDSHIKRVEDSLNVQIVTRGEEISVTYPSAAIEHTAELFQSLLHLLRVGMSVNERDVVYAAGLAKNGQLSELYDLYDEKIATSVKGKVIRAKTLGQKHYVTQIRKKDMTFGIECMGTGKTYLAVVMAVNALKDGAVHRIVLTRPAVEAGKVLVSCLETLRKRLIHTYDHFTTHCMMYLELNRQHA